MLISTYFSLRNTYGLQQPAVSVDNVSEE